MNITKALQRLRAVAGSSVTNEEIARIKAVERLRNRVAHFALYGENPRRTEVVVARGLDVLLHLIDREFSPMPARKSGNLSMTSLKGSGSGSARSRP